MCIERNIPESEIDEEVANAEFGMYVDTNYVEDEEQNVNRVTPPPYYKKYCRIRIFIHRNGHPSA